MKESPGVSDFPPQFAVQVPGGRALCRDLPAGLQHLQKGVQADLLVFDGLAERPAHNLCRLAVCVFDRAEEGIDLPLVAGGVLEDAGDDAALVLGGDRGVLAGAERHVEQAGLDHRSDVQQPLGEVGRPDVGDRQSRPVEDPVCSVYQLFRWLNRRTHL
ncbi:hypothetical protein [Paraburkholderia sp. GAS42]|uniref:hypothetical protein n=1 Tax=Paraburkholderia sp. GAS42 TaxID=3035135 RepID=UPI003D1CD2B6